MMFCVSFPGSIDTPDDSPLSSAPVAQSLTEVHHLATHGLDIEVINSALAGRVVGSQVLWYDSISSTMDEARRLASKPQRSPDSLHAATIGAEDVPKSSCC